MAKPVTRWGRNLQRLIRERGLIQGDIASKAALDKNGISRGIWTYQPDVPAWQRPSRPAWLATWTSLRRSWPRMYQESAGEKMAHGACQAAGSSIYWKWLATWACDNA